MGPGGNTKLIARPLWRFAPAPLRASGSLFKNPRFLIFSETEEPEGSPDPSPKLDVRKE
jgi:hypothetical protein